MLRLEVDLKVKSEELGHIQLSEEFGPDLDGIELLLLDPQFLTEELEVVD